MKLKTEKLYNHNPFQSSCEATVIGVDTENGVITDKTVSYAEAGGQEGDRGTITILGKDLEPVEYFDTQKGDGEKLLLSNFPKITVGTPIFHKVDEADLGQFEVGQKVKIEINIDRRSRLTVSHSAIHIALMGLEDLYPSIYGQIRGCHIKPESARLDFNVEEKMTAEDFQHAEAFANKLIQEDVPMTTYAHPDCEEAFYWQLGETVYSCGGSHLKSTAAIGPLTVKKKNLGKNMQRLTVSFPEAKYPIDHYYKI